MIQAQPKLVVFTTLFPSVAQPTAGLFIRERMFRVAEHLPLVVVAPQPWFPLQGLLRRWRPNFRPPLPALEIQDGIEVHHPRFLSIPGLFKSWDGWLLAWSLRGFMRRLHKRIAFDVIDAHFGYPDGYAATRLGAGLGVPVTITLRGTEVRHAADKTLAPLLSHALQDARRIFTVSESLRQLALKLGIPPGKAVVVANGVDTDKFMPVDRQKARAMVDLPDDARVMITVGGLVERKGIHRVLEVMPALLREFPDLHYLIVGGASAEGDWSGKLKEMVVNLGLDGHVHFLGVIAPEMLKFPLSAADVFVLSTRNEGWANVLLEAMACGLPVVASDVGGNREVVPDEHLGTIVEFGHAGQLQTALRQALKRNWDRPRIIDYARENGWHNRIQTLVDELMHLPGATRSAEVVSTRTRRV